MMKILFSWPSSFDSHHWHWSACLHLSVLLFVSSSLTIPYHHQHFLKVSGMA